MATTARSVQDMLPLDLELPDAPGYDERARQADRDLCQRYFNAWCGSFGSLDRGCEPAGHSRISFADFQAAADRLAGHPASDQLRLNSTGPQPREGKNRDAVHRRLE